MSHRRVRRVVVLATVALTGVVLGTSAHDTASAGEAAAGSGRLFVVQAVPQASYSVALDGTQTDSAVGMGTTLGPFDVAPGKHQVSFTDGQGGQQTATVEVRPGSSTDLVLHRPADVGGDPVANTYRAPMTAIGPGKSRVLLAHTATVPPADVRLDGKTVFTNIANGEYAEADVPAGLHTAALLPTGQQANPILGPIDVDLPPSTLTMVYAVGSPTSGSMNVIVHQESLARDGSVVPRRVNTGSAGLARDLQVVPFGTS